MLIGYARVSTNDQETADQVAVGEVLMAPPAISSGMIFIRGQHHVFAMGAKSTN